MSELIRLPEAKTEAAKSLSKRFDVINVLLGGMAEKAMFVASAIVAANDLPATTTPVSVSKAVLGASYLQLPFGNHLGFAYLLPFKSGALSAKAGHEVYEAALCIGYKGFLELGYRSQYITNAYVDVVVEGEEFDSYRDETGPRFLHKPLVGRAPHRGNIIAAYCQYFPKGQQRPETKVIYRPDIDKKDKKKDVWNSNFPAMCTKSAVRLAAGMWRKTPEIGYAIDADERYERDEVPVPPPVKEAQEAFEETEKEAGWSVPTA